MLPWFVDVFVFSQSLWWREQPTTHASESPQQGQEESFRDDFVRLFQSLSLVSVAPKSKMLEVQSSCARPVGNCLLLCYSVIKFPVCSVKSGLGWTPSIA